MTDTQRKEAMFSHLKRPTISVPDHIRNAGVNSEPGIAFARGGISAKVIEATWHDTEVRPLITMQLRYPRFIHAEFMTHRVFSRNASSSRAIPVAKMIEQVRNDPAMPIHWGQNQPGMQAHEELVGDARDDAIAEWQAAAKQAADQAEVMNSMGLHKQVVNRILEPFQFMHVIVTATEWDNFFDLRAHPDAQPEIQELAYCMLYAARTAKMRQVMPTKNRDVNWQTLDPMDLHLPYVTMDERLTLRVPLLFAISAARCARVSYLKHDGTTPSLADDIKLFLRLVGSEPLHASPIEHQGYGAANHFTSNFRGYEQFRSIYRPNQPVWQTLREQFAEKVTA